VIPALLGSLQIKPVLLHGDLWVKFTFFEIRTLNLLPFHVHDARAEIPELIRPRENPSYSTRRLCTDTTKPSKVFPEARTRPPHLLEIHAHSLAIGRMFGGIPRSFFQEYHKHMPKTEPVDQYELRGDLYELFHYLNHTVLFGVSEDCLTYVRDRC
jgi:hypothetical protein